MIFRHTLKKVLSGQKTQTCRLINPNDYPIYDKDLCIVEIIRGQRSRYKLGRIYKIQSGRGVKACAKFELLRISQCDVRQIDQDKAEKEGFESPEEFLKRWVKMHVPVNKFKPRQKFQSIEQLDNDPGKYFQAWVLEFELIRDE